MKLRSTGLAFACLLLMGSLASAATTDQTEAPVLPMEGVAALMAPVEGAPDCASEKLPFLNPTPEQKGGGAPCGACSESVCAGYTTGTICGYRNGQLARCESVWGYSCTTGGLDCSCWIGDIP